MSSRWTKTKSAYYPTFEDFLRDYAEWRMHDMKRKFLDQEPGETGGVATAVTIGCVTVKGVSYEARLHRDVMCEALDKLCDNLQKAKTLEHSFKVYDNGKSLKLRLSSVEMRKAAGFYVDLKSISSRKAS